MKKVNDEGPWLSISDMMTGLMIIFLFISITFMIQVQKQQEEMNNIIKEYAEAKVKIYNALEEEFKDDLPKWDAKIESKTLSIRFDEPEVLFHVGSSSITPKFKVILDDFFPRYIAVLSRPEFKDLIQEIRIEGHTSSEWQGEKGTMNSYFNNMKLSQDRTRSVLEYSIMLPKVEKRQKWLIKKITANGLSFSNMIVVDNKENAAKSRRVEFRIRTNADEKMELLKTKGDSK
jgi:outer membrane protein OmpA-like peptidoglycan-associated protein